MKIKVNVKSYAPSTFWQLRRSIGRTVFSPRKVQNYVRLRASQLLKKETVRGLPTGLLIEPSSYCNLNCPMCARNYMAETQHRGNMSASNFGKLMDDIGKSLLFTMIFGYGEPMMNPDILKIIRLAKENGTFVVLGTNGQLFDQDRVQEMMQSPPDLMVVSLDATTEKSYQEYRAGGDFNRVLENIKYISDQKKSMNSLTPLIDLQFLAMEHNEQELPMAGDLMKRIGADQFSVKRVASYYTDCEKEKIKDFLPAAAGNAYSDYGDSGTKLSNFCSLPWRQTAVNWDGTVIPCCKDIDAVHPLGNAFETSLSSIWNGGQTRDFRRRVLADIDGIDICRGCNRRAEDEIFIK